MQLDLSSYEVDVVNTTVAPMPDGSLSARVYSLENKLLFENTQKVQVGANALTPGFKLDLAPLLSTGMVFVRLALNDAAGKAISDNLYWLNGGESSYRPLNRLPPPPFLRRLLRPKMAMRSRFMSSLKIAEQPPR